MFWIIYIFVAFVLAGNIFHIQYIRLDILHCDIFDNFWLLKYWNNFTFHLSSFFHRPKFWDPDQELQTHISGHCRSPQRALPGWIVKLKESQNPPSHGPRLPQVHSSSVDIFKRYLQETWMSRIHSYVRFIFVQYIHQVVHLICFSDLCTNRCEPASLLQTADALYIFIYAGKHRNAYFLNPISFIGIWLKLQVRIFTINDCVYILISQMSLVKAA